MSLRPRRIALAWRSHYAYSFVAARCALPSPTIGAHEVPDTTSSAPVTALRPARMPALSPAHPHVPRSLRLLVVDDDSVVHTLLRHILPPAAVTFASSAEEALRAAEGSSFDAVLLDIRLPGEYSGVDLLPMMRARMRGQRPCFVAMTASYGLRKAAEYRAAGFDEFFPKPFSRAQLRKFFDVLASRLDRMSPMTPPAKASSNSLARQEPGVRNGG